MKLVQEDKAAQVNGQPYVIVDEGSEAASYWLEKGYAPPKKTPSEMELEDLRAYYKDLIGDAPDGRWSKQRILEELKAKQDATAAAAVKASESGSGTGATSKEAAGSSSAKESAAKA